MIPLEPFQEKLTEEVRGEFRSGARAVVMQAGTGAGKTYMASNLIDRSVIRGNRVVFLAHLDALIEDTHERLADKGIRAGFVQAGRPVDPDAPVQVASLQTLIARPHDIPPAHFVILDECHRAEAAGVSAVLDAYPNAHLLGLTATPQRGDGRPLGRRFQALVCGPSNRWLTEQGYLSRCDVIDPNPHEVQRGLSMDPVQAYLLHGGDRRAIFFASNTLHAEKIRAGLWEHGVTAACVLGDTPREQRRKLKDSLADGSLRALISCNVFVEGWDCPSVEVVVLGAAFGVTCRYLQGIGRGLRPSPSTGKQRCTVIDLPGAWRIHGLPDEDRVWSLTGKAVRRAETLTSLTRCKECLAIFRPSVRCPRCGVETRGAPKLPRVLTRHEKAINASALPEHVRHAAYLRTMKQVGYRIASRKRFSSDEAKERWVNGFARMKVFEKFGKVQVPA